MNKNRLKSGLSLGLALLFLLSLLTLASCGNAEQPEATDPVTSAAAESEPEGEEPAETKPVFPEIDLGGRDFLVYMRSENASSYPGIYIDAEEQNGDVMNDQVFVRNDRLEQAYKLVLTTKQVTDPHNTIKNDLSAGSPGYDLILDRRKTMTSLATGGYLANLRDCGVDYTTPWWATDCIDTYTVCDKLFFVANDVSVSNLAGAEFYYFNTAILTDNNLKSPYDYVKENKWTWESFITLVNGVSNEAPEGVLGTYGLVSSPSITNAFLAAGIPYIEKNGDEYKFTMYSENADRAQTVIDTLKGSFSDPSHVIERTDAVKLSDSTKSYANDYDHIRGLFAEGHFLLISGNMKVSHQFLDMKDPYGVIVFPKLNSDQERYYSPLDTYAIIWCLPNDKALNIEENLAVLDYWAYESSQTVMPAYYEVTLKSKRAANKDGADMLDLVKETIVYDISDIFGLTDVEKAIEGAYTSGSVSILKSYEKKIGIELTKLISNLSE